jgi:drug/metabolite transporter (DMT)-like permease
MKTKSIGIALILIGVVMTIYTGFNYVTTEKVVDIGPIQINQEKNHPVQWAPIVGIIVLAAGAFLVVKDSINKD